MRARTTGTLSHTHPHQLSSEQISDPYSVIRDLFQFGHLPDLQHMLWNSFKTNITGTYNKELTRRQRNDVVYLYEYLERLLEAAWIIEEGQRVKRAKKLITPVLYPFSSNHVNQTVIEKIANAIGGCPAIQLQKMTETIARLTNAEKIFWIGQSCELQYDFLALLPGDAPLPFKEYQNLIESQCAEWGTTMLWCSHLSEACKYLKEGHIFYSSLCTADRMVYDNKRIQLPIETDINIAVLVEKARSTFEAPFSLSQSFLDGSKFYTAGGKPSATAFMLHQAAEHALRAFVLALAGYSSYHHDLGSLLKRTYFIAPQIAKVFPQEPDQEKQLFQLLNRAYTDTRYKSSYKVSAVDLISLLDKVAELQTLIREGFEDRLTHFENQFK
jgi:HEPN domain-containing protein